MFILYEVSICLVLGTKGQTHLFYVNVHYKKIRKYDFSA